MSTNVGEPVSWPTLDYQRQSVEVAGTRRPGQTGHYRNSAFGLLSPAPTTFQTLDQIFDKGLGKHKNAPMLGRRPVVSENPLKFADHYVWETYEEVDERRRNLGSALHKLFRDGTLGGGDLETVGIWSANRPEWQVVDLALHIYNKVGVSLYDTLGKDAVEYIINHAQVSVIFATKNHIPTLLKLSSQTPTLKMIVSIDELTTDTKNILGTWCETKNIKLIGMRELEAQGKENRLPHIPPTPKTVVTICYTSGTTSVPKGVLLTHQNLSMACHSNLHGKSFGDDGVLISYLPLAHIYERINEVNVIASGGRIGYFTGDPLRLLEDAQILKPNYFPSVPRVLNRIYQAAMVAGNIPGLKGYLFNKALQVKLEKLYATGDNTHVFWDRLVFKKIQAVLGGNIRLLTCGSAPIGVETMDFLKVAFACEVVEGYGMTENCGTCTRVWPNDPTSSGSIGPPQPVNELKLIDVPSMDYTSEDKPRPRGELCVRGNNCFTTYYKDSKNTKETVDDEGWLHTGDVAEIDECGRFRIIDRIKNIMKLAQGEYVALEKIENVYSANPLVAQLYVHGDSLQDHIVAVLVPEPPQFAALVSKVSKKVSAENVNALAAVANDKAVVQAVLATLDKEASRAGLKGFERVKKLYVTFEAFTTENGLLTPTFKVRRKDAHNKFKKEIDALYALPSPNSTKL